MADEMAPSPELLRLINAGQVLANCAFNMHQQGLVGKGTMDSFNLCRIEWDQSKALWLQSLGDPDSLLKMDGRGFLLPR